MPSAVVAVAFQPVRERLTRLANRLVFGKRATPYEVLSRFSRHLGETVATEQTMESGVEAHRATMAEALVAAFADRAVVDESAADMVVGVSRL